MDQLLQVLAQATVLLQARVEGMALQVEGMAARLEVQVVDMDQLMQAQAQRMDLLQTQGTLLLQVPHLMQTSKVLMQLNGQPITQLKLKHSEEVQEEVEELQHRHMAQTKEVDMKISADIK